MSIASATPRNFEDDRLSLDDFERIAAVVTKTSGICLPRSKMLMVEGRLRRRVRALGYDDYDSYCRHLFERGGLQSELADLIDAVTTNKTDFFREPEHFKLLTETLAPRLLEERRGAKKPMLKAWSAASSIGAEAYTIAMVLADLAQQRRGFNFAVLGTDISPTVLKQARTGVYPEDMTAPVPQPLKNRYLMRPRRPDGPAEVRIVPELRRQTRFARLNLMDETYRIDRDVDVIFLRNVLIYFDRANQAAVINRLIGHLRPNGYLLLGHSESMVGDMTRVRQVASSVFQKV